MRRFSEVPKEFHRRNGHAAAEIVDVRADNVIIKPVEWLWRGRIPKNKLTMFDGDPDLGKSVVTIDIAARVSTGRPFPDDAPCEVGNVLIVNVEDGIEDTIVPRLKAHGADLSRIFIFSSVPDDRGGTRLLELPQDIVILENKVIERDISLVIIDPVLTMLGGDSNKDQDARKALTPIRDLAERRGVAVVCIRHLNKSVGLKAIQRGGGNMGLIGVARAGSFFAEHPDDDTLKVMAAHKSNLAEKPPSLSYRIVSSEVHDTARVEWVGVTDHDANSLASGPASPAERSKLDEAKEFLSDELADRPMWAKQVLKDARDAGIAQATLYSAKTRLRVRSEKIGVKGWQWSLPTKEGTTPLSDEDVQNVQNVHSLQNLHREHSSNSPYLSEDPEGPEDPEGYEGRALEGDDNDGGGRLTPEQVDRVRRLRARGEVSSMAEARRLVLKEESVD
jgi:AAA domain